MDENLLRIIDFKLYFAYHRILYKAPFKFNRNLEAYLNPGGMRRNNNVYDAEYFYFGLVKLGQRFNLEVG